MPPVEARLVDELKREERPSGAPEDRTAIAMPKGYTSWKVRLGLLSVTLVTGVSYLVVEYDRSNSIEDAIFVSMLMCSTAILLYGLGYLRDYLVGKGIRFYNFVLATDNPEKAYQEHNKLCRSVLNTRWMTLAGIAYGLAVGSAPYVLNLWGDAHALKLSLAGFLFAVNFVTGVAFYGLIAFFGHAVKMGEMIDVDIWRVNKPSTEFILGATRRISVVASVYASISNTSILFSVLPINYLVIAYFVFSGATILASVVVPSIPIARKLHRAKMDALHKIEEQLYDTFKDSLERAKEPEGKVDTSQFESLLTMKERIESFHVWPFRIKSILAALSVIFFSAIPLVVQSVLKVLLES
jgi:hypothetical protein